MYRRRLRLKFHGQVSAPPPGGGNASTPGYVFLALIVLGVLAWFAYNAHKTTDNTISGATQTAALFVDALTQDNYDAANGMLTDSARALHPSKSLQDDISVLTKSYGPWLGSELVSNQPRNMGDLKTCSVDYRLDFQTKKLHLHMLLVEGYKKWLIASLTYS